MNKTSMKPIPMAVEEYHQLADSNAYPHYLADRDKARAQSSAASDPLDGGPTDEAVLAEWLTEQRKR